MKTTTVAGVSVDAEPVEALTSRIDAKVGDVARQGGLGGSAVAWAGDGRPRWFDRKIAGAVLRWLRPCFSDAEYVDLQARMPAVGDEDPGWLRLVEITVKLEETG